MLSDLSSAHRIITHTYIVILLMSIAVAAVYYNNINTIICVQHGYVILSVGICDVQYLCRSCQDVTTI